MGKIIVSTNMSLDGVIEDPDGEDGFRHGGWYTQAGGNDLEPWREVLYQEALATDALLLGRRTAEEKVASFLVGWRERLAQIGDERQTIALPMSRQDIADYLGLTIETVSRTLTRFEREKMLIIVAGGIRLLDASRAAAMAAA